METQLTVMDKITMSLATIFIVLMAIVVAFAIFHHHSTSDDGPAYPADSTIVKRA